MLLILLSMIKSLSFFSALASCGNRSGSTPLVNDYHLLMAGRAVTAKTWSQSFWIGSHETILSDPNAVKYHCSSYSSDSRGRQRQLKYEEQIIIRLLCGHHDSVLLMIKNIHLIIYTSTANY